MRGKRVDKKSILKNLKKNLKGNEGMALVTVIVAIGFVAALVSILLTTTLVNYKMKVVNERGKDTFYSAEQVLDEITVGLQRRVSDSLSSSYTHVLENYGDYENSEKSQLIQSEYYTKLWSYLEVPGTNHQKYDVAKLEEFLKESTKWHEYNTSSGESGSGDGYGAILTAVVFNTTTGADEELKQGDMYTYSGSGIVLKNVKVYYKDVYGFVSVIQTDIRLNYPGFEFAKNSALADITNYCFIADGGVTRSGASGDLNIDGNIYANNFFTKNVNTTVTENNLVLVKHNIDVQNQSFVVKEGTAVWAKNIKATSATVNITGTVNLSNDLNLAGNNPKAIVNGVYNGYGNSLTDAENSSAILINGKNTTIDFSRVKDMKLYGHAYLGLSAAKTNNNHYHDGDTPAEEYKDLTTGESIAVKSDQLMYLVPAEAIGVDKKTGRALYGKNPLTKAEYNDLLAKVAYDKLHTDSETQYVMISDDTPISTLGGSKLMDYIQYDASGTQPKVYTHQIRTNDTIGTESIVYFYMLFGEKEVRNESGAVIGTISAEQIANDYFQLYYNHNEDTSKRYADNYIDKVTIPNLTEGNMTRAGYSYVTQQVDGQNVISIWAETQQNVSDKKSVDSNNSTNVFTAYTSKLIPNISELGAMNKTDTAADKNDINDPNGQIVFENVVSKKEDILAYIDRGEASIAALGTNEFGGVTVDVSGAGDSKTMKFTDAEGNIAIVATEDVSVNDTDIHLVITTGNVTVSSTAFDGVILCDKELKFTGTSSLSCTKKPDLVIKCLQFGYEDAGLTYAIASCLEGGNDYVYSSYGDGYSGANSLEGLVTYENWKKE